MEEQEEIDITKIRYVLYARKSTDDAQRQVRSIDDQIAECKPYAKRIGIHIVDILEVHQSAKKPHKRPVFNQMLKDVKSGKYDAILAWNPDRLCRNMLESGIIIDMVDENIIRDLKFVTHHFTNDANGKMILGIAFVLSKQYSDKLSQDVSRGVKGNLTEGKSPIHKHGYRRNKLGLYEPDGSNFNLIKEAWNLRRKGQSLDAIAQYLNDKGYTRKYKDSDRLFVMNKKILSDVFRDPFYYGILVQARQKVDLRDVYDNFVPAITEEIYSEVQELSQARKIPYNVNKRKRFYPFRSMVQCAFCGKNMVVGPSSGYKKYLYFRCDTKGCTRKKKSVRGQIVIDFLYKFFEKDFKFTKVDYDEYYKAITEITESKRSELQIKIHSKEALLKNTTRELKERGLAIVSEKNMTVRKINEKRIDELEAA